MTLEKHGAMAAHPPTGITTYFNDNFGQLAGEKVLGGIQKENDVGYSVLQNTATGDTVSRDTGFHQTVCISMQIQFTQPQSTMSCQ